MDFSFRDSDVRLVHGILLFFLGNKLFDFYIFVFFYQLQKYENPVLGRVLEEVCQTFHLPLTQYWTCKGGFYYSLNQFSGRDFENLAPWCQFKDACLCKGFNRLLGVSNRSAGAFFCSNISALSITKYHLAHYAKNLGSIACFTIYLLVLEEEKEYGREYALEFFLPSQEMDNDYPQTLLNCIWTKVRESLPNCKLAAREREKPGQVLLVKVINSSTHSQPKSFEVGHPQSSLPHNEGSEFTHTLELFEKGPNQISNSKSYEEAAVGETSIRILNEASQPRGSEEYFNTNGKKVTAERGKHDYLFKGIQ